MAAVRLPGRTVVSALAAIAATALLGACGSAAAPASGAPGGSAAPSPSRAAADVRASVTPTTAAPSPASGSTQAVAGPASCATTDLRVTVGQANGTAGSIYYPLEFTNVSSSTCTLYGYPGVSFVTGPGGSIVGGAAVREPVFPKTLVTLAPGAVAHASLQVVIAGNYPTSICKPVTAKWLQIYPPNQYSPLYVSFTAQTCTGSIPRGSTLGIYVVRPGSSGP